MEGDTKNQLPRYPTTGRSFKPGIQFSTNKEETVKNPDIKLFYDEIREKSVPLTILYYTESAGAYAEDIFIIMWLGMSYR